MTHSPVESREQFRNKGALREGAPPAFAPI